MKIGIDQAVLPVGSVPRSGRIAGPAAKAGGFKEVLAARPAGAAPAGHSASPSAFQAAAQNLAAGSRALDRVIELARQGKKFSPQELLVLQAEIYRVEEGVMLATKAAEQVTSGLRRLWELQV